MIKKRISQCFVSCLLSASLVGCAGSTQDNTPPMWWGITTGAIAGTLIGAAIKAPLATLIGGGIGAIATVPFQKNSARVTMAHISKLKGAQVIEIGDYVKIVIQSDKLFGVLNDRLRHDPDPYLDNVAELLNDYPKSSVLISAFADDIEPRSKANELTQRQAQKVLAYLWDRGVNWRRMRAVGCGEINNIATNRTTQGSAFNRRIEITLIKPEPTPIFSQKQFSKSNEPELTVYK